MGLKTFFLILAAACFLAKALAAPTGRVDLMNLGFFCVTVAFII